MGVVLDILRGKVPQGTHLDSLGGKRISSGSSVGAGARTRRAAWLDGATTGYSASAVAYRCVAYIASNLASVDLAVVQGDEPNPDHPVARLWNRAPNPSMSARVLKEVAFSRLELLGEQFIFTDRGATAAGEVTALWPIYGQVEVLVDAKRELAAGLTNELLGFRVRTRNGVVGLLPSEMLWLRYPDPFDPWGALAPWKAALFATEADAYARAWQLGEFRNGGTPRTVVYLGDLDEEEHDAAVADFRANVEGADNAARAMLVSGPTAVKVERLSFSPAEMSYLESRTANADEVMLAFGLRADLLKGQATYENQRASKVAAWSDVLVPKLEVLASETDRQLLPNENETAEFDVSGVEALRENADAVWLRVGSAIDHDLLQLDEGRAELGFDPLPGGIGAQTITAYRQTASGSTLPTAGRLIPSRAQVRLFVGAHGLRTRTARPVVPVVRKGRSAEKVAKFYDRHERIGQRAVKKLAAKQERVVLRKLKDLVRGTSLDTLADRWLAESEQATIARSDHTELPVAGTAHHRVAADDLLDAQYWREQTAELMDAFMDGVWTGGAENIADTLGLSLDQFDTKVLDAMRTRVDVLAAQVTETTRQVLDAQLLLSGVEGGESIDQLAARISSVFEDLAGFRAERIARTETVGGFNGASRIGAIASGVVDGRTWLSAHDSRVRESHQEMDGETINGMAGPYSNGLMHPGDPTGPARETVNCRCVETYNVREDA